MVVRVEVLVLNFGQSIKNLNSRILPSYYLTSRALTSAFAGNKRTPQAYLRKSIRMSYDKGNRILAGFMLVQRNVLFDGQLQNARVLITSRVGVLANVLTRNNVLDHFERLGRHFK